MKEILKKLRELETNMELTQKKSDYWMEEEHFDAEKSEQYEAESDTIYEQVFRATEQAAEKIVSITSGQIDKPMAMAMLRCKRSEVERLFA